jgi:hypothetical protein
VDNSCIWIFWNAVEVEVKYFVTDVHPEGAAELQHPPPKVKLKKTDFVDTMISNILCDLPFGQTQPLESAYDS